LTRQVSGEGKKEANCVALPCIWIAAFGIQLPSFPLADYFRSLKSKDDGTLIALTVILGGAIGALLANLRRAPSHASLFDGVLGAVVGFFALVIIMGGKFLFILDASSTTLPMNPYALALTGLLAGLFSDRAYTALEGFFDRATVALETQQSGMLAQHLNVSVGSVTEEVKLEMEKEAKQRRDDASKLEQSVGSVSSLLRSELQKEAEARRSEKAETEQKLDDLAKRVTANTGAMTKATNAFSKNGSD